MAAAQANDEETDEHELPKKRVEPLYDPGDGHYRYERRNDPGPVGNARLAESVIRSADRFLVSQGIAVVVLLIVIGLFAGYYYRESARQDARDQAYLNAIQHMTERLDSQKGALDELNRTLREYNHILEQRRR